MSKKLPSIAELLLQISVEEGEKYDEAYKAWQWEVELPLDEVEAVLEPEPESTPLPTVRPPGAEAGSNRVIGENDRRRVERGQVPSKPAKQAYREKGSGFQ